MPEVFALSVKHHHYLRIGIVCHQAAHHTGHPSYCTGMLPLCCGKIGQSMESPKQVGGAVY